LLGLGDRAANGLDLLLEFVTDVDDAARGAYNQPAKNHSFDHQMRRAKQNLAVLECPWLAFVAVANHILRRDRRIADLLPFFVCTPAGPAHAQKAGSFQCRKHVLGALLCVYRGGAIVTLSLTEIPSNRFVPLVHQPIGVDIDLPGLFAVSRK